MNITRNYHRQYYPLFLALYTLLGMPCWTSAQFNNLPIIGDTVWNFRSTAKLPALGSCLSLAEGSSQLFYMTEWNITVLDSKTGSVREVIYVPDLFTSKQIRPYKLRCDRKGSKLILLYHLPPTTDIRHDWPDSFGVALVSYPDKKVIKNFSYCGENFALNEDHVAISPDGRWVVYPGWCNNVPYMIYDCQRDTSYEHKYYPVSDWSFDSSSHQLAVSTGRKDPKANWSPQLKVYDLTGDSPKARDILNPSYLWNPKLSVDGKFIVASYPPEQLHVAS